jgi:hypothetical protein
MPICAAAFMHKFLPPPRVSVRTSLVEWVSRSAAIGCHLIASLGTGLLWRERTFGEDPMQQFIAVACLIPLPMLAASPRAPGLCAMTAGTTQTGGIVQAPLAPSASCWCPSLRRTIRRSVVGIHSTASAFQRGIRLRPVQVFPGFLGSRYLTATVPPRPPLPRPPESSRMSKRAVWQAR